MTQDDCDRAPQVSEDVLQRAVERQRVAGEILGTLGLMERWSEFGVPRLVGAAAYGLMVAPDIDIESALTEETRIAILTIKEAVQGRGDVHSMDVYRAVLDDGVRTAADFLTWQAEHKSVGLTSWRPTTR